MLLFFLLVVYSQNMENVKSKVIIILGPTASGKSDAAIKLAKKFDGEIISADSRQIYKGLNLGSGKILKDKFKPIFNFQFSIFKRNEEFISEGIQHYLIDVAESEEDFNVSHFKEKATEAIEEILAKSKLPIICGGTGFWIDAIVKNVSIPEVPPNEKLRKELDKQSLEELFAKLQKLDPERAETIDSKNKVRLIRAIEICKKLGKVPVLSKVNCQKSNVNYDFLQIGIDVPREELNAKIKKRLEMRFKEGMLEEVEGLIKQRVSTQWLEKIGLEYRWLSRYLQNQVSLKEMQEKLYFDIIHYAKRQMTWFKKNKKIVWLKDYKDIEKEVEKFLR